MKRYYPFNDYLKKKFGCKVYKVSVDAGFTCPNRDGTVASGGCIYCDDAGSRASYCDRGLSVREQILKGIELVRNRYGARKFIAYFQAFTNTYAPAAKLKSIYDQAFVSDDVVGIAIGTRPDCVGEEVLDVIEQYALKRDVWIELGVQTVHDRTLAAINRGHTAGDSLSAIRAIKRRAGLKVCAHIIVGLPGEGAAETIETARELSDSGIDGVKVHCLHVLKGTIAEKMFAEGKLALLAREEYVRRACDVLENIRAGITVQRLTGEAPAERLVAPLWVNGKQRILKMIDVELERRDSFQGKLTR
ncbi:MAG TPA: TIGR01212 family radical SAM protein [bacterium]|nr:TIGR01212 family radical SAM protein [bacterium]